MVIENVAKHLPADGHVTITNNTKYNFLMVANNLVFI